MINRKAGINVNKLSDNIRKRAFFGTAIFCITAIAAVGALSMTGKEDTPSPDLLVDLNETDPNQEQTANQDAIGNTEQLTQTADNSETKGSDTDDTKDIQQTAQITPDAKETTTKNPVETAKNPETTLPQDTQTTTVADQPQIQEPEEPVQTANVPDENTDNDVDTMDSEPTQVLSPNLIAETLEFDRSMGLLWPVEGEVVIPYSPEHGVYHYTLDQFGTSEAIVLSSSVGTEVKAAAKGVVISIEEDIRTGTTVTLALGNNTELVYGQLDLTDLKEGDILEAGECLGTVAEPTKYYVEEGPNLYFQVKEGEETIDPGLLLTEEE